MRNTLLGSCLLALSIGVAGCDDATKKEPAAETGAPAVTPPAGETKGGAMEGAPKGGAMEAAPAPTTPPAETATPPEKKDDPK